MTGGPGQLTGSTGGGSDCSVSPGAAAPANLHISVTAAASTATPLRERVEQKFFITPDRMSAAMGLLWRTCRLDPEHPVGQVNSLYFDTFDLEEHARCDSGDFAKDKIRIRWYGTDHGPHDRRLTTNHESRAQDPDGSDVAADATVGVWVERKTRRGFTSTKQRLCVDVSCDALAFSALGRGIVSATFLLDTVASFGFFPDARLCPVIAVSYRRHRFVEPVTGFRVSIDQHIRSSLVLPGYGQGERGLELPGAVVEIKGSVFDMPLSLRALADIGSSWTRYSKYSSSLDAHAASLGSVSRLWPSGMMQKEPAVLGRVGRRSGGVESTRLVPDQDEEATEPST